MPKKLYAIVGYTNWGKSNTLYELFDRKQFFPLKSPITCNKFNFKQFTVINASNEDRLTKDYLIRLKKVLSKHINDDTIFVITIYLNFENGTRDVKDVFEYLDSLTNFDVTYIVLTNGWDKGSSLKADDVAQMKDIIKRGSIRKFDAIINQSRQKFKDRTYEIATLISN